LKEQLKRIESLLKEKQIIEASDSVLAHDRVHGGSINDSFRLRFSNKSLFVKLNRHHGLREFFSCEKKGLELLRSKSKLKVPEVVGMEEAKEQGDFLVLEYLEESEPGANFWESFGRDLAQLHQNTHTEFGLGYDNYIGALKQSNRRHSNWVDFFIEERLEVQYQLARDKNYLDDQFGFDLKKLFAKLPSLIPEESPSLLHGDLWSGNYMVFGSQRAAIFDPAVYFGHREVDLAMMHLFGGFHHSLFDAYHEAFPLEIAWEERIDLFNLYPLLVHVNLFGGSYASRARQVLNKYL